MVGERRIAVAIDPDHLGGDALPHLRLVARIGQDHQPAVRVEVDESGRDHHPGRVDRAAGPRGAPRRIAEVQAPIRLATVPVGRARRCRRPLTRR